MKSLIKIKTSIKKLSELGQNDNYIVLDGTLFRYIRCGRTWLHDHRYIVLKRINKDDKVETYKVYGEGLDEKCRVLDW